jgi:hypothetical protein
MLFKPSYACYSLANIALLYSILLHISQYLKFSRTLKTSTTCFLFYIEKFARLNIASTNGSRQIWHCNSELLMFGSTPDGNLQGDDEISRIFAARREETYPLRRGNQRGQKSASQLDTFDFSVDNKTGYHWSRTRGNHPKLQPLIALSALCGCPDFRG